MRSLVGSLARRQGVSNASPPVPYTGAAAYGGLGALGGMAAGDRSAQLRATESNSSLYAIVNRTSTATAKPDWHLWRKSRSGKPEDRIEVTSHAFLDLWNDPAPGFRDRQQTIEEGQRHVDLTGECCLVIARHPRFRLPLEAWVVAPDRMFPVPSRDAFMAGWFYVAPDGERVPLGLDEVIQIRMPGPDPYRGHGPVQALLASIDAVRYSLEWNRNFFRNSAEPGGVVSYDTRLGDDEFREIQTRWREQHRGVSNAHRVAILERGATWTPNAFTQKDMQFTELLMTNREILREAFSMPKFALGLDSQVNRATAEASLYQLESGLTVPRLDRWKGAATKLLKMYPGSEDLEVDYDSPIPADRAQDGKDITTKTAALRALLAAGVDEREACEYLGLPTFTIIKPKPPAPPPLPPGLGDPSAVGAPEPDDDEAADPVSDALGWTTVRAAADDPTAGVDLQPVQRAWEAALAALLDDYSGIRARQRTALLAQVREALDNDDLGALAALAVTADDLGAETVADALVAMAATGADGVVAEAAAQNVSIAAGAPDMGPLATLAAATASVLAAAHANAAGREALRLYRPGESTGAIVSLLRAWLVAQSDASYRVVLGGALTRAQNAGRHATLMAAPTARYYASEKLDKNTCDPCKKIDGKRLPTLDAAMTAYGGGPYLYCEGTYRCRGTFVAVWEVTG